jgi:hypothetical protein
LLSNGLPSAAVWRESEIMNLDEPKGLLAIWANIDTDYELEFVEWHNCQHMEERVTIPGFHVGHRYRARGDERGFFMVYETDTADVMKSEPYLHSQNNPTPWTRESIGHFRDTLRTIYSVVAAAGDQPATDAPYVLLVRSNPPDRPDGAQEVIRWYQEEHLPRLCAVEGALRARLYRADRGISNIVTAERKVHGASSGEQEFLALYELASPEITESEAWKEAARGTEWSRQMVADLRDMSRERYWLDFALWAPRVRRG